MTEYRIVGSRPLHGSVLVGGAKNALLPILAATILYNGRCEIHRAPHLSDVENTLDTLRYLGAHVHFCGDVISVDTSSVYRWDIPASYTTRLRASVSFLAPLLARFGRCSLAYPGGCSIGKRPINYHLDALRALGNFDIREQDWGVEIQGRLIGGNCVLPYPSVGATECALMAAAASPMPCTVEGGAMEPEVADLCGFLNACGGAIKMEGSGWAIKSTGMWENDVKMTYTIIPDRIESGTYALAIAATRGEGTIVGCNPQDLQSVIRLLVSCGVTVRTCENRLYINAQSRRLAACPMLLAYPYPAFPTDLQAPACAFLATCPGRSCVLDTVFPERYAHIRELRKFGARIALTHTPGGEQYAWIEGNSLHGARGENTDLRAGAALLIAGLCAKGESVITDPGYIARGYEAVCEKFRGLGGRIWVK